MLVADDHPMFREGLRTVLEATDDLLLVAEAADGAEAVRLALTEEVDVALFDIHMPEGGGIEAAARVHAEKPDLHVLMLTMFQDDASVFAALRAGADEKAVDLLAPGRTVGVRVELTDPPDDKVRDAIVRAVRSKLEAFKLKPTDGEAEVERVHKLAADLGLGDQVRFVDPVPHHLLSTYYRAADVCLVPSRSESFGLVALEAAACGTPVVASAVGGLRTLVEHARTGFLVEGRDPASFARFAREILTVPAVAAELSGQAASRARGYTWSTAAGRRCARSRARTECAWSAWSAWSNDGRYCRTGRRCRSRIRNSCCSSSQWTGVAECRSRRQGWKVLYRQLAGCD